MNFYLIYWVNHYRLLCWNISYKEKDGKEETGPVSGEMFTRQDDSFLFYGSWIEENRRFFFVVKADEN